MPAVGVLLPGVGTSHGFCWVTTVGLPPAAPAPGTEGIPIIGFPGITEISEQNLHVFAQVLFMNSILVQHAACKGVPLALVQNCGIVSEQDASARW